MRVGIHRFSGSLIILLLCFGCGPNTKPSDFLIAFSQCTQDPWRKVMEDEMYRELSFHPDVDFVMRTASEDSRLQIEQIRELMALEPDLLIVSPNEAAPLTSIIEEVYQLGIPVILIDRKTESNLYTAYVGADNYEVGHTAGKYIANKFGGVGEVIEIYFAMTISPAFERRRGLTDALSTYPALNIVASINGEDLDNIKKELPKVLSDHPKANIIFGHTDLLAETAHSVAKQTGSADELFFVGVDGIPGTGRGIEAVVDGVLGASMLYPTGGREAIRLALSILHDLSFEKMNLLHTTVIDPTNARIIQAQMKTVNDLQNNIDRQNSWIDDLSLIQKNQNTFIIILVVTLSLVLLLGAFLWRSLISKQRINKVLELKNQEILGQQEQIMNMSKEVQKATQAKVNFFTNVSHEIRTPLTLILGFVEDLLPTKTLNQDVQQSFSKIHENSRRLLGLVNQLLDFRKIESEKIQLKASEYDIVDFVQNIMKSYARIAEKRSIEFRLHSRQKQLLVWFDSSMLDKVIFNLLSNAFKFTADGGSIQLRIGEDRLNRQVEIEVKDDGLGISPEEVRHIFEPFFQGEKMQHKGTGLGLSLSKSLVELHQGTISVTNTKGKGSCFRVRLPLGKEHFSDDQIRQEPIMAYPIEGRYHYLDSPQELVILDSNLIQHYDQQLLIIEDNTDIREFLRSKLGDSYDILLASDGQDAIDLALEQIPDLIICDVMLPGKNGLEITKTLKSDLRTSHIPIILLTARTTIEQKIEGTQAGADAYVEKPFHIQFLREKIKNLILNRALIKEGYQKTPSAISLGRNAKVIDRDFLQRFATYIELHYTRTDLSVAEICTEMGLSRSQLYRKLKALIGQGITDYIQQVRLEKSERLLLESDLSIAEVAYKVGYTSPDYFSTVFKSKYNTTPTSFRKDKY